ncbi:substrate-binding domain-containing protein [Xanthomonas euvesicatoria pv. alangii]|uniref:LysR family substrate-binding domain-containing protein n=1 Tax=Xanthomonas euvesicatoria TaxID=456327 RepID=UPI001C489D88|nr:LysR family substrate-binding domain-containing protein [Xanthomonas euvesicatoria]MBV6670035.1 substrate-binding domain-containing protein [Xanthomonas euvesicatoria pv. alangii]
MHDATSQFPNFRLAIAPGVPSQQLSALLTLQHAEEPEVAITLNEVSDDELVLGLHEGRYDAGVSLCSETDPSLSSQPLWHESLAAVVPSRSPLLDKANLTIHELLDYPVFLWHVEVSTSLTQRMPATLLEQQNRIQYVTSFEMMALWVAAGYGIGISAQSRIARARSWGLTMRPLSDGPYQIITYLRQPIGHPSFALERFKHRALQVQAVAPD